MLPDGVHMSPQEEECTTSSRGDSKMYTSGSTANSKRMLIVKSNKIIKSCAIAKVKILVESDTVKHLKTFRIISIEMLISLLILS